MSKGPKAKIEIVESGEDVAIYVVMDGVRIAQRGRPDTSHAAQWISIEPGWVVRDGKGGVRSGQMIIEYNGAQMQ